MTPVETGSTVLDAYLSKVSELHHRLGGLTERLDLELSAILSPAHLVQFWKLREAIRQTVALLEKSLEGLGAPLAIEKLDLIIQVEQIITDAEAYLLQVAASD